jgi:hypothetical protein
MITETIRPSFFADCALAKFLLPAIQEILIVVVERFTTIGTESYLISFAKFVFAYLAGASKPGGTDRGYAHGQIRKICIGRVGRQRNTHIYFSRNLLFESRSDLYLLIIHRMIHVTLPPFLCSVEKRYTRVELRTATSAMQPILFLLETKRFTLIL